MLAYLTAPGGGAPLWSTWPCPRGLRSWPGTRSNREIDALLSSAKAPHTALATLMSTASREGHHVKKKEHWGQLLEQARAAAPEEEREALRKALGYA